MDRNRVSATLRIMSAKTELDRLKQACSSSKTVLVVDDKEFGEVLRYHREDAKIKLNEMAKALGVSTSFLSDCERGNRKLKDDHQLQFVAEIMKRNKKGKA